MATRSPSGWSCEGRGRVTADVGAFGRVSPRPSRWRKLRVAVFVDSFPCISEPFILNQLTGLLDRGHAVRIFARRRRGPRHRQPDVLRYGLEARTTWLTPGRGRIGRIAEALGLIGQGGWGSPRGRRLAASLLRDFLRRGANKLDGLRVASHGRHGPFDIVHCQYLTLGRHVLPWRRAGLLEGRLLCSVRGHDISDPRAVGAGYAALFAACARVLPVGANLARLVRAHGCPPEKIEVLHSAIDLGRFPFAARRKREGPLRLLSVGRLMPLKGLADGIEAAGLLRDAGLPLTYRIVGEGPQRPALEELIRQRGLRAQVELLGALNHAALPPLLARSDVLLTPSVTPRAGNQEGIPNVLKEALASGLPVIATRHGGIPELVEHDVGGLLVPERDPAALAAAVRRLCEEPELGPRLARAGRAKVEAEFAKEALNDRLEALYLEVARA